jgi:fatty acid desaturase
MMERRGDTFEGAMPELIDSETIRRLSRLSPWIGAGHIVLEWGLILGAAALAWTFPSPWLYPLAVIFIGARQHALMVLMHEGAHYRLFEHRKLNDWVSEVVLSWPLLLFTMRAYRRNHWPHHRHTNEALDPDWQRKQTPAWRFPRSAPSIAASLAADATGAGFVAFLAVALQLPKDPAAKGRDAFTWARGAFVLLALGVITALELWVPFLLLWIVPFVTWLQVAFHVRSIAEHSAIPPRPGVFGRTRTTLPTILGRLFLVPKNVGYHLEHHLYPSVPFYRLPALHAALMDIPAYRASAHVSRGYLEVLRECTVYGEAAPG